MTPAAAVGAAGAIGLVCGGVQRGGGSGGYFELPSVRPYSFDVLWRSPEHPARPSQVRTAATVVRRPRAGHGHPQFGRRPLAGGSGGRCGVGSQPPNLPPPPKKNQRERREGSAARWSAAKKKKKKNNNNGAEGRVQDQAAARPPTEEDTECGRGVLHRRRAARKTPSVAAAGGRTARGGTTEWGAQHRRTRAGGGGDGTQLVTEGTNQTGAGVTGWKV